MHARWGLAGLLGFEVALAVYTSANGAPDFAVMALVAAGALAWGIVAHERTGALPRAALLLLVAVTLWRGLAQTFLAGGAFPAGVLPTFLVPLGFALLLWPRVHPGVGIALVAAARSWFVAWYFLRGADVLALANVVGAFGAWLWWAGATFRERPAPVDEGVAQP